MKKIIAMLLCILLLCGCSVPASETISTHPVFTYDWMAGESPIPVIRTGLLNQGMITDSNGFECTKDGAYYMLSANQGSFLCYCDHGSDTVVKLCSRPDCTHSGRECNAYFNSGRGICFYDGFLYTVQKMENSSRNYELIRLNLDGTERVSVIDTQSIMQGYGGSAIQLLWNGIFNIGLIRVGNSGESIVDFFYYRLDGSMDQFEPCNFGIPYGNDGTNFLLSTATDSGTEAYALWDPDTKEITFLTEKIGNGYYGAEEAYYILDGVIYHYVYSTNQKEALFDTELDGEKALYCYPDCFVIADTIPWDEHMEGKVIDSINIYLYNWNFDSLGQIELDYSRPEHFYKVICGETPERIILTDNSDLYPRYYIEKADFGTDNIQIHEFELPDGMIDEDAYLEPWEE